MTSMLDFALTMFVLGGVGLAVLVGLQHSHIRLLQRALLIERARCHRMLAEITRLRAAAEAQEPCRRANGNPAEAVWPTQH